jgi:hypothetical protein
MISGIDYLNIVSEAYDLSDYKTKKKVLYCTETQKTANIEHLTNRLYKHIKNQTDKIDFGTIPKSKGDISKVEHYQDMLDCITTMHDMVMSYRENTRLVDQLSTAIDNVVSRQRMFEKAFALNIEFPIMTYNSTVLSIVSGVSLLIISCIEYVKNGTDTFTTAFDKAAYIKTKDHVLFQYIVGFNKSCSDGTIDKVLEECIKKNLVVKETAIEQYERLGSVDKMINEDLALIAFGVGAAYSLGSILVSFVKGTSLIYTLIYPARAVCYYFKYMQMKISDWFAIQSEYLQINAENLKYREDRTGSNEHKSKVYSRQIKWAERFRKVSNFFALKDSKSRRATEEEEKKENNKPYEDEDQSDDTDSSDDDNLF